MTSDLLIPRLLFACCLTTATALAQMPAPAAKPGAAGPPAELTVAEAAAKLRAPGDWRPAFDRLTELAQDRRQEVLEAIAPGAAPGGDADVAARICLLIDRLWREHCAASKRDEVRARARRVADATADLERALEAGADARAQAMSALRLGVERLQESLASEAPLTRPEPFRVPTARAPHASAEAEAPPGYRKIDVDGKTFLVPADALPAGENFKAEFTESGLVVRRAKKAPPKDGDGATGKDRPAGGEPEVRKDQPKPGGGTPEQP